MEGYGSQYNIYDKPPQNIYDNTNANQQQFAQPEIGLNETNALPPNPYQLNPNTVIGNQQAPITQMPLTPIQAPVIQPNNGTQNGQYGQPAVQPEKKKQHHYRPKRTKDCCGCTKADRAGCECLLQCCEICSICSGKSRRRRK